MKHTLVGLLLIVVLSGVTVYLAETVRGMMSDAVTVIDRLEAEVAECSVVGQLKRELAECKKVEATAGCETERDELIDELGVWMDLAEGCVAEKLEVKR